MLTREAIRIRDAVRRVINAPVPDPVLPFPLGPRRLTRGNARVGVLNETASRWKERGTASRRGRAVGRMRPRRPWFEVARTKGSRHGLRPPGWGSDLRGRGPLWRPIRNHSRRPCAVETNKHRSPCLHNTEREHISNHAADVHVDIRFGHLEGRENNLSTSTYGNAVLVHLAWSRTSG